MESSETPHQCFNDSTHEFNGESFQVINQTVLSSVRLIEEEIPTGGFFRSEGFALVAPANSTHDLVVSWPYPVGVLDCNIQTTAADIGNTVQGVVGPNTVMGILTSDAGASSAVLSVSSTVIENVHIGLECVLDGELIGEIIGIDAAASTVTIDPPLSQSFTAGILVGGQRRIIKNFNLGYVQGCSIGSSKIGASYIPVGVTTRVTYTNNSPDEKTFNFNIEYLY
jgi:hypothetical protein